MEDEEPKDGQSYDSCHHDYDDDDSGLTDVLWWLLDDKDDHVDDKQTDWQEDGREEQHEVAVVALGNAGPYEAAMVVENLDTIVAGRTVAGSLRPEDLACTTETSSRCNCLASFCRCSRNI